MAASFLWRGGTALDLAADWTEPALGPGPAPVPPGPADSATIDSAALGVTGALQAASLSLTAAGTLGVAAGGVVSLFAPVSGSGTLAIGTGATLFAADALGAGLSVAFQGSGGTLELFTAAARVGASITGFAAGDAIDIADAAIDSAVWAAGTLTLGTAGGGTLALALPGSIAAGSLVALPDGQGGSVVRLVTPTPLPAGTGTLALDGVYAGSGSVGSALASGTVGLMGTLHAGSLSAGGLLTVLPGGTLSAGTLSLAGTLLAEGAVALGSATPPAGTLAIGAAATLVGSGRIDAALTCDGVLRANGGALGLFGDACGSGTLAIGAGATLFAAGTVAAGLTVAFGADATLDLAAPAAFAGTLAGLVPGDAIDLGFAATLAGLPLAAQLAGQHVVTAGDGAGGTLVTIACYAAGTRLAAPAGAVPVEALRAGNAVLALQDGAWRPVRVRWVGRGSIDLARHPQPEKVAPVRIRAGAIAEGVPARDLLLSPDHAVFLDGALIQAQALRNGATVVQEFPDRITYLHVELDRHAILCAEGLAAESYLDTGNRALFAGEAGARPLHPDLAGAAAWDERACAPLLLGGARVAAMHARVLARAATLGFTLTEEAGLELRRQGDTVRLVSRSFVPAWLGLGEDRRRLGVAVASLRLDGRRLRRSAFGTGWHAPEPGWRWTDGDALLHLPQAGRLTLRLAAIGARYWRSEEAALPCRRRGQIAWRRTDPR